MRQERAVQALIDIADLMTIWRKTVKALLDVS
jgi:hypothetical protein